MMQRLRELFHFEVPNDGAPAPVPGTGEVPPTPETAPPAEASPTEPQSRDLGPIPYARFQEVNERRRDVEAQLQPYVDLESEGYGVDDLQRLTAWEREYQQDPVAVWLRQAQEITALPDAVKAAIDAHLGESVAPKGTVTDAGPPPVVDATPKPSDDEPPAWAKPLLEREHERIAAQQQEAIAGALSAVVSAWKDLDTQQQITSPSEKQLLRYIQTSDGDTPAEILRSARENWLADREELLKDVVKVPGQGTVPRTVPGSGAGAGSQSPVQPASLREATKLAIAASEAGQL